MGRYNIPSRVRVGLKEISEITEQDAKSIAQVLDNSKVGDGIRDLVQQSLGAIRFDEITLSEIIATLFSMVNIFTESEESAQTFVEDFTLSYKMVLKNDDKTIDDKTLDNFKNNLFILIPSFKAITQTLKVRRLQTEGPNNFFEAKVLSDIRIAFDDTAALNSQEQVALVVHNLKIDYFDSKREGASFFLSMSTSELTELSKVISRAIDKDKSIRTTNHKLTFVDLK